MTPARRWPKRCEAARLDVLKLARSSIDRLNNQRPAINRNPLLAELMAADTIADLERIIKAMEDVRNGVEEEEPETDIEARLKRIEAHIAATIQAPGD